MELSTKGISMKVPNETTKDVVIREVLPGGAGPGGAGPPPPGGSKETPTPPPIATPPQEEIKPKEIIDLPPTIQMPLEIKSCKFYHGIIPRVDAEMTLRFVGDYLLRRTEPKEGIGGQYLVISVKREGGYVHVPLSQEKEGGKQFYFMTTVKENTVLDLIDAHL